VGAFGTLFSPGADVVLEVDEIRVVEK